jgi:hypothetical protein
LPQNKSTTFGLWAHVHGLARRQLIKEHVYAERELGQYIQGLLIA